MQPQIFEIPSSSGSSWLSAIMIVPLLVSAVLAFVFWPRALQVELTADSIRISGSIYGRTIPRQDLDLSTARITTFSEEPELRPTLRTNGVGLPRYRVGWFRLKNGVRALCFLTAPEQIVYLPTTQNFVLLISMPDAERFLAALRGASS